jgi:hypothetical protein
MDPQVTRIDRALETAYVISQRAHRRASGAESWAGPQQLIVVVPPGGRHFHQPYCPRAGLMEYVHYMPLTRALRQRLPRCQLCWPLHRVCEGQPMRPQGEGTENVGTPGSMQGATMSTHLTVCLPRLPPPRVGLHAPSPSDYAAEWQVLIAFLLAAMPHSTQAGQHLVPRSGLPIVGRERLSWPELLQAARRLVPRDSIADVGHMLTATGAVCARHRGYASRVEDLSIHSLPTGSLIRPSIGDVEFRPRSQGCHSGRNAPGTHSRSIA